MHKFCVNAKIISIEFWRVSSFFEKQLTKIPRFSFWTISGQTLLSLNLKPCELLARHVRRFTVCLLPRCLCSHWSKSCYLSRRRMLRWHWPPFRTWGGWSSSLSTRGEAATSWSRPPSCRRGGRSQVSLQGPAEGTEPGTRTENTLIYTNSHI